MEDSCGGPGVRVDQKGYVVKGLLVMERTQRGA